jgi:ATP-dependent Clp protease ATP-binding subunit ClpC
LDGEDAKDDKARFTFRGETKPSEVPDAPPVSIAAAGGDDSGEVDAD